jgi:hypothetical protein
VYEAVLVQRRDPEEVGREFGLAAGTVQNIARWTHKRLAEAAHELLGMSPMEILILRHDRLQWQSRELDRAWQTSAADRQVTDKIVTTIRKSDGSEQTVERDVTRMLHSKGPDPRYQRLRDQLDDKLHGVIQEIKELQAKAAEEVARKLRLDEQAQRRAAEAADPSLAQARLDAERAESAAWHAQQRAAATAEQKLEPGEVLITERRQTNGGAWIEQPVRRLKSRKAKHQERLAKEAAKAERLERDLANQKGVIVATQGKAAQSVASRQVEPIASAT